jgi:hypothetical protein
MEAASFIVAKIYYGLAAMFSGYALSFFWQPAKLRNHGRLAAGAIIGGISVGTAVIFGGGLAVYLGMNPNDANTALAVGGSIGIVAVAIISLLANFFDKRENHDLLEVVHEVTTRKAPAKKVARKAVKRVSKK